MHGIKWMHKFAAAPLLLCPAVLFAGESGSPYYKPVQKVQSAPAVRQAAPPAATSDIPPPQNNAVSAGQQQIADNPATKRAAECATKIDNDVQRVRSKVDGDRQQVLNRISDGCNKVTRQAEDASKFATHPRATVVRQTRKSTTSTAVKKSGGAKNKP